MTLKNQKGITLIALIITIIVMLILVGVTINVALNGGLFSKAEEATTKTKIVQIQEALTLKKAEVLANYNGKVPADYEITIDKLNLPTELKTQYGSKLIISKDAKLYYDASVVTDLETQKLFKSMGMEKYTENSNRIQIPEFYGVGYWIEAEGITMKYYFLKNDVLLMDTGSYGRATIKYTKNENQIAFGGASACVLSEDYQTLTINGGVILTRNENDIYEYAPTYDNTNNIYSNAFYADEKFEIVMFINEDTFADGLGAIGSISELLSNSEISENGKQITYKEKVYTLVEEI